MRYFKVTVLWLLTVLLPVVIAACYGVRTSK